MRREEVRSVIVSLRDKEHDWAHAGVRSACVYKPWWAILGDSVDSARVRVLFAQKDPWWSILVDFLWQCDSRVRIDRPVDEFVYEVAVFSVGEALRLRDVLLVAPEHVFRDQPKWRSLREALKKNEYEVWVTCVGCKPRTVYGFVSDDYWVTCAEIERVLGVEFLKNDDSSEYGAYPYWLSPSEQELLIYKTNRTPEPWRGQEEEGLVQVRWEEPGHKDVPWLLDVVCTDRPEEIKRLLLSQVPAVRLLHEVLQEKR